MNEALTKHIEHALNLGRVDLIPSDFDKLIYQHGAKVQWEKSCLCSCLNENGQPDFTCIGCDGKGYVYFDKKEIRVLSSSFSGKKDQIPVGLLDVGTALISSHAVDRIGFRDRITFLESETPYSQVLVFDSTKNGAELKFPAVEIVSVRILNIEIPPSSYSLSENGRQIIFEPNTMTDQEKFSILCRIKPSYIVIDMPHELRGQYIKFQQAKETWFELPKQFMIKREDLLPKTRGELL